MALMTSYRDAASDPEKDSQAAADTDRALFRPATQILLASVRSGGMLAYVTELGDNRP
jgi:hypothetical protein